MLKHFGWIAWFPIALPLFYPQVSLGMSGMAIAQTLPTPPAVPLTSGTEAKGENDLACFIRMAGRTVNLNEICGITPGQTKPPKAFPGISPNAPRQSASPLSSEIDSRPSPPQTFGSGSAYAEDGR